MDEREDRDTDGCLRAALDAWRARHRLTRAEVAVALHVVQGLSNKEIAIARGTSTSTVRAQISNIIRKVEVTSRAQLAYRALKDVLEARKT